MNKKKRPPGLVRLEPPQPVVLHNPDLANLTDHTEVIVNDTQITIAIRDMEEIVKLGQGQYGTVEKVRHKSSGLIFAVKKIRCSMNDKDQASLLKDLNISMRSSKCPYVVVSYGAMIQGGDVWIMMELLDMSLKDYYEKLRNKDPEIRIPEEYMSYITFCIVTALEYLHRELHVIHRDVKPSNILLDKKGRIKVCDFGISGELINSLAKTNVGTQPYLAPERINPDRSGAGFSIKADVWSLGLTVLELSILKFPYEKWNSLFDQLKDVVNNKTSPSLSSEEPYTDTYRDFISKCLIKADVDRASYHNLIEHDLLKPFKNKEHLENIREKFSNYVSEYIPKM